jgi:hypothetical protein
MGRLPFNPDTHRRRHMFSKICVGDFSFDPSMTLSPSVKDCIHQMLQPSPDRRATMESILSHDFVLHK